jgi:redox-sensitive bicupin YhaK (pirin superfamily)
MIALRRADERLHLRRHKQEVWLTFYPQDRPSALVNGFGFLKILNEDRIPPGARVPLRPYHASEIVTYVHEGALAHEDSTRRSGISQAGEFRRVTAGRGVRHSEMNASDTDWAHVFQIGLHPFEAELEPSDEQKRFSTAERRGDLCVVASPDGRRRSLRIHQDLLIYSALLDPGQHLAHALLPERSAWLHVVQGEATVGDVVLTTGDGVGVSDDRALSLTAWVETEILLLDLATHQ